MTQEEIDERHDVLIEVTIQDILSGKTVKDCRHSGYYWAEGNGSCDCNRCSLFGFSNLREGICDGCERFIITEHNSKIYNTRELNEYYPINILTL